MGKRKPQPKPQPSQKPQSEPCEACGHTMFHAPGCIASTRGPKVNPPDEEE